MKKIALVACLLLSTTSLTSADSRNAAEKAIVSLRRSGKTQSDPDGLRSIDSTFLAAEQYRIQNRIDLAESHYLLAIQKVRILLAGTPPDPSNSPLSVSPTPAYQPPLPDATSKQPPSQPNVTPKRIPQANLSPTETAQPPLQDNLPPEGDSPSENIEPDKLVGCPSIYSVGKRETLRLIAAKLGVSRQHLVQMNNLDPKVALRTGQKLKYNNLKIIPQSLVNGIIINIPDRTLYFFRNGKLTTSLPVALGTAKKGAKYDWTTPTGKFTVTAKVKDPTWYVPHSIQAKMEEEGKDVVTSVPPGPRNPLGKYAIKTSLPGILIHSTTRPGSIYSFASHGCIRVYPEHMEQFFKEIRVNTQGEIIYHPVKLAITADRRIFLEVHRDAYGKSGGLHALASQLIEQRKLSNLVDWDKVEAVIARKAGFAEDITL